MNREDLIRAWKDPFYRVSMSSEPAGQHPSGVVELTDDELKAASGLSGIIVTTFRTCTEFTFRRFHCCN